MLIVAGPPFSTFGGSDRATQTGNRLAVPTRFRVRIVFINFPG
jgi:hypothetical protein